MNTHAKPIELQATIWMTLNGNKFGGQDRIALLARIASSGSITQAAKALGMSYKAAWDAIDSMNALAGQPLVQRSAGGKGGGGTRLTARGQQLVDNFRRIQIEHERFMAALNDQAGHLADDYLLIRRMSMKTSARNQFHGTVTSIKQGAVNDEIEVTIAADLKLIATVTRESVTSLGLRSGVQVFALVKASSIVILSDDGGARFSARNRLDGTITRILTGAVNSEVVIGLPGNNTVAAIITNESCRELGLAAGQPASALFKASAVIIGLPA